MKKAILAGVAGLTLLAGGVVYAAKPAENINPAHHPNLAKAQTACRNAFNHIVAAQKANEWDMNGHAQKAKDLLDQASNELREAATTANQNAPH
jgi:hypothetical protein